MKRNGKQQAVRRLRIAKGQIEGLERMVRQDQYCIDILRQSLAVKEALSSFERVILQHHLDTHVAEQMRKGEKAKSVKELLEIYRLSNK
ncbi:MAG: metal-sensitive transcriptional regulator [Candidatus Wildermuthbacteria bacterium]|nr:metal-sensitive transcriptional regulator [Candidatus Wildermuthbacteria bacterium]